MSAWSSSTGKAQLSYADRLRQASKSNSTTKQEAPPSSGFATRAVAQDSGKVKPPSSSSGAAGSPSRRLSSASSASATTASGSVPRAPATSSENKNGPAQAEFNAGSTASGSPPVNVWEARRKQLADREAEKERERRAALAQQKQASPAAASTTTTTTISNAGNTGNKAKQTATAPKKANERPSKGSSASSQSDRKGAKPATQSSNRVSNSVPIASTSKTPSATPAAATVSVAPISDKGNASSNASRAKPPAASPNVAGQARPADRLAEQSTPALSLQPTGSSSKAPKSKPDDKVKSSDSGKDSARKGQATSNAQSAAAEIPPSSALSVQTISAPPVMNDDIPASPATVASAIEEVLKNGGAHGAQTEDDDAWLARIHLLNGGQNMPKFGGFGPNGGSGLSEEAEIQAAKKAERAVAAAWGVGKSVWNKSQQQQQQQQRQQHNQQPARAEASKADASKASTADSSSEDAPQDTASQIKLDEVITKSKDGDSAPTSTSAAPNSLTNESSETGDSADTATQKVSIAAEEAGPVDDADLSLAKKAANTKLRTSAESQKPGKAAASPSANTSAASVPSFEDVNNWPSPLDAGKKLAEKPKVAASSGDHDKVESSKTVQPKTPKSLYETLDELQVRLAPGANAQHAGNAAGARKGKQQWVSILPEITHTTGPALGAKANRPTADTKTGKGANKQQQQQQQQRKDGNRGSGQTQQSSQNAKKDGPNKSKSARAEDKAQVNDKAANAAAGAKMAESRGQPASQGEKAASGARSNASARTAPASTQAVPVHPASASPKHQAPGMEQAHTAGDVLASAGIEQGTNSAAIASPTARDASPSKQLQQQARTNSRPQPNGIPPSSFQPQLNGIRPPKSTTSSGAGTPITSRSSPRGSVASSPKVHALPRSMPQSAQDASVSTPYGAASQPQPPPLFYGPSGVATPMLSTGSASTNHASWLPYNPYARPTYMFDATTQTGAPLPSGVLGQLLGQIEFYFSQHNLQGDFFLRQKMDGQGWVDIAVVAGFKRVQAITGDLGMVKDALLCSAVLDVDEERMRVRRRWGWELYTLTTAAGEAASGDRQRVASGDEEDKVGERPKEDEEEEALGVVSASGFGGKLEV